MLNTLGIVEVHHAGGQLQAKLARKLGGKSLLEMVVRRVTDCLRLDDVIVLVSDGQHAAEVAALVPPDVRVVAPQGADPLARFIAAATQHSARALVRVAADHPFVDPVLIDRLVSTADAHPHCDYISYCRSDGRPAILTQLGVLAEWCTAGSLARAAALARRAEDRRAVTSYLYGHPEQFSVRLIPLPLELDREDLRLKIDHEEDWDHAQVIYDALGHDEWDWRRIAVLLDSQPALRHRMALLNGAVQD